MADKRLRLIVEAVTSQAQQKLRSFGGAVSQFSDEASRQLDRVTHSTRKFAESLTKVDKVAQVTGTVFGTASEKHAVWAKQLKEGGVTAEDAAEFLKGLGVEGDELTKILSNAGYEMQATAGDVDTLAGAVESAKGAIIVFGSALALLKLGEKAVDLARVAAANLAVADSFEALAARSQVDSKLLLESLDEASKGTISDLDLMREANEAWYLGIAQNIKQYSDLMKIAEEKSKDLGISTLNYWQRLTNAISSGYPATLRQLGVVIDMERAYESYGAMIGKAADDLTEHDRIQARVNAVIIEGEGALRDWEQAGLDATTVTQDFDAATANLSDTIKKNLLPVLIPAMDMITTALRAAEDPMRRQQEVIAALIKETGSLAEAEAQLAKNLYAGGQGFISQEMAAEQAMIAILDYKIALIGIDKGIQEDVRAMRMGEQATMDLARGQEDLAEDTEEAAKAADKAEKAWSTYLRNVAEQNWRFGRRVEDAQFRAGQAAEKAAFSLYEIERDAGDRRGDLLESVAIRVEADTARHYNKLRYMRRDLLDELRDMNWDYEQDRSEIMRRAPYWIRNALQAEFQERERIAATGDTKALKAFDHSLRERIRALDPAYAEELDLLQEQYKHEKQIERRESRQARRRQKQDWSISIREQDRSLDLQLRQLERGLGHQLERWQFHALQREASEKWSMERMITDHDHQLGRMYDDTERRLGDLPPLYKHYGYTSWNAFLQGFTDAQRDTGFAEMVGPYPFPTQPFAFQQGTDYVPRTMPAILHKGEAVLPAPVAQQFREGAGGVTIHIENLNVAGGRAGAKQFVRQVEEELGRGIRQRSR